MLSNKEITNRIDYWVWLTTLPGIGTVTINRLWEQFRDIIKIYNVSETELSQITYLKQSQKDTLIVSKDLQKAQEIIRKCIELEIGILTIDMPEYPNRCRNKPDISPVLYCKGKNEINIRKTVGIIGRRRCSDQGKINTIHLTQEKCKEDYAIISGFAKGIDSYAHTAAIKSDGYTVGVLGNGIDICYPSEQLALKNHMEKQGLFISQYPPGTLPQRFTFPIRNKLIAALSDELYVMEMGNISGAQSTIDAAIKYGKKIYKSPILC